MPTPELIAFGQAVRAARAKAGLKLSDLAGEIFDDEGRKGYLSQVENGKRRLSPLTIAKIADQLDIDGPVLDAALGLAPPEDEPAAPADDTVATILAENEALRQKLKLSEALAVALAYEYAEDNPTDIEGALIGLRQAFETAAEAREKGRLPSNTSDAVAEIMAEVDRLNEEGRIEDASATLDSAIEASQAREDAERATRASLIDRAIAQAILANDPEAAARYDEQKALLEGGDLHDTLRAQFVGLYERGRDFGNPFDLRRAVALTLRYERLTRNDEWRGSAINDRATALAILGERGDDDALRDAVTAYRDALEVRTRDAMPAKWAMTRENMAICYKSMAEADPAGAAGHLRDALTAVEDALTIYTPEQMPFYFDKATRLRDHIIEAIRTLSDAAPPAEND